jgi:hypothetical protein
MRSDALFEACRPGTLMIIRLPTVWKSLDQGWSDTHHSNCALGAKIAWPTMIAGQSLEVVAE